MAALLTVHHKPEEVKFGGESISDVTYLLLITNYLLRQCGRLSQLSWLLGFPAEHRDMQTTLAALSMRRITSTDV